VAIAIDPSPNAETGFLLIVHSYAERLTFAASALLAITCLLPQAVSAATVSTLAGSGLAGFADGPGRSASFMLPVGIAWDGKGRLYVADAAAQRLRVILPDGSVRTVAGSGQPTSTGIWVPGGYADGNGSAARFNTPMGIAVGPNDDVYVADARNHCVRKVTPDGTVSTFAGSPSRNSGLDGPLAQAGFSIPVGVAVDPQGIVYVADSAAGIRRISLDGQVSTLPVAIASPIGIAVSPANTTPMLWVANADGLWRIDLTALTTNGPANAVARFRSGAFQFPLPQPAPGIQRLQADGQGVIGFPSAISVINDVGLVYTDVVQHTVRYANQESLDVQLIGGQATDDAPRDGGGFADGPTSASRFDAPMGIAARSDGTVAVADSGNKRIRLITAIDRTTPFFPWAGALPDIHFAPNDYRIALIGASTIWGDGPFTDSVGGEIQRMLRSDPSLAALHKTAHVMPVRMGSDFGTMRSYADLLAESRFVDCIVVVVTDFSVIDTYKVADFPSIVSGAPAWQGRMAADVGSFQRSMNEAQMPVLFVTQPLSFEMGFDSQTMLTIAGIAWQQPPDGTLEKIVSVPFQQTGVNWLDAWPAFYADERSPSHRPVYLSLDGHFTTYGNTILGRSIAQRLEIDKPWMRR